MQISVRKADPGARHVLLVHNPNAGRGGRRARIAALAALLRQQGAEVHDLTDLDRVTGLVEDLLSAGKLRAVVAAGGDGTVAELANRLPAQAPLAVLPLGTENLLAKYLGQRPTPEAVARTIETGLLLRQDAGRANGRIFLLMSSTGFDAEVVRRVADGRRGNISHATWIKPIWQAIRSYQYPELKIYLADNDTGDDGPPIDARWAFIVNLPRYARGLTFAPAATGSDGVLDVCLFQRGSFFVGLKYLWAVIRGRHELLADCQMLRGRRLRIESDAPVPYQLDGDAGGMLPVEIECLPERVTLVVPETFVADNQIPLAGGCSPEESS